MVHLRAFTAVAQRDGGAILRAGRDAAAAANTNVGPRYCMSIYHVFLILKRRETTQGKNQLKTTTDDVAPLALWRQRISVFEIEQTKKWHWVLFKVLFSLLRATEWGAQPPLTHQRGALSAL